MTPDHDGAGLPPAGPAGRRTRPVLWIGVAVVLVAAGVGWLVAGCEDRSGPPVAAPTTATTSAAPGTAVLGGGTPSDQPCLPTVVESGFSVTGRVVHYGLIAGSDCAQAVIDITVAVRVLDGKGRPIAGHDEDRPALFVMLPGQRAGAAGSFYLDRAGTVTRVEITVTGGSPAPVSAFADWPRSVSVEDLRISKPDEVGRTTVTGRIGYQPAGAVLCAPHTSLIVRDSGNRIIYGLSRWPRGRLVSVDVAMPADADRGRTRVYVTLGQPAVSLDQLSTITCRS